MDNIDLQIIAALQENGRATNLELSKRLGVGEATIRRRLKTLISQGRIKINAIPNPLKVGIKYIVVMGLQVQPTHLDDIANKLSQNEQVSFLSLTTGQFDIMLILLSSEPQDLTRFIREQISTNSSILRTESFVSAEIIKSFWTDTLDLASLLDKLQIQLDR